MGCLVAVGLVAIVVAMGVVISTLAVFFMGLATIIVTSMAAFIAFLLVLL